MKEIIWTSETHKITDADIEKFKKLLRAETQKDGAILYMSDGFQRFIKKLFDKPKRIG